MESKVKFSSKTAELINDFADFSQDFYEKIIDKICASDDHISDDHILIYYTNYDGEEDFIPVEDFFNNIGDIMDILKRITKIRKDVEENDIIEV